MDQPESGDEKTPILVSSPSSSSSESSKKVKGLFMPYALTPTDVSPCVSRDSRLHAAINPNDSCGSRTENSEPSDQSDEDEFDDLDIDIEEIQA